MQNLKNIYFLETNVNKNKHEKGQLIVKTKFGIVVTLESCTKDCKGDIYI